jgi:hypothetical protein
MHLQSVKPIIFVKEKFAPEYPPVFIGEVRHDLEI